MLSRHLPSLAHTSPDASLAAAAAAPSTSINRAQSSQWHRWVDADGDSYWHQPSSGTSRWLVPEGGSTACGWEWVGAPGHPAWRHLGGCVALSPPPMREGAVQELLERWQGWQRLAGHLGVGAAADLALLAPHMAGAPPPAAGALLVDPCQDQPGEAASLAALATVDVPAHAAAPDAGGVSENEPVAGENLPSVPPPAPAAGAALAALPAAPPLPSPRVPAPALLPAASGRFDRAHAGVLTALADKDAEEGLVKAAPQPLVRADSSRRLIHTGTKAHSRVRSILSMSAAADPALQAPRMAGAPLPAAGAVLVNSHQEEPLKTSAVVAQATLDGTAARAAGGALEEEPIVGTDLPSAPPEPLDGALLADVPPLPSPRVPVLELQPVASGRFDRAHAGVLTALAGKDAEEGLVKAAPQPLARADFSRRLIHTGTRVSGGAR